jgi:hypothetical protein
MAPDGGGCPTGAAFAHPPLPSGALGVGLDHGFPSDGAADPLATAHRRSGPGRRGAGRRRHRPPRCGAEPRHPGEGLLPRGARKVPGHRLQPRPGRLEGGLRVPRSHLGGARVRVDPPHPSGQRQRAPHPGSTAGDAPGTQRFRAGSAKLGRPTEGRLLRPLFAGGAGTSRPRLEGQAGHRPPGRGRPFLRRLHHHGHRRGEAERARERAVARR